MSKLICSLVLLLFSAFVVHKSFGQPVSEQQAEKVATNFLIEQGVVEQTFLPLNHQLIEKSGTSVLHLFHFEKGFIVIPAHASLYPVLAFSDEIAFNYASTPSAVEFWFEMYTSQVLCNIQNEIKPTTQIADTWAIYDNGSSPIPKKFTTVEPMLSTTWNQGCFYNTALPEEPVGPCGHLYTGCVATALAQILNYYHYPKQGTGSHSLNTLYGTVMADFENTNYGWVHMERNLSDENPSVSELMLHCVVAVNSQFFPNGTGAYDIDARHALVNYFRYHPGAQFRLRQNHPGDWNALILSELEAGRPVIYGGVEQATSAGHTFIVDGFQEPAFFHINWGWGGQYNGFFYLDSLIAGNYHFDYFHDAITGIRPDIPETQLLYPPENLDSEVDEHNVFLSWLEPGSISSLELIGFNIFRNEILLNESIVTGLEYTDEDVPPGNHTYSVHSVFIGNGKGPSATTEIYVSGIQETGSTTIKLFPNPSNGEVFIELDSHLNIDPVITLFDLNGRPVFGSFFEKTGHNTMKINLSDYPPGVYFLGLTQGLKTRVQKIVLY
jgi:hypothetical protein